VVGTKLSVDKRLVVGWRWLLVVLGWSALPSSWVWCESFRVFRVMTWYVSAWLVVGWEARVLGCCLCYSSWLVCPAFFGVCVSPSSLGVLGGIAFSGGLLALFFLGLSLVLSAWLGPSLSLWQIFACMVRLSCWNVLVPFLLFGVLALSCVLVSLAWMLLLLRCASL